MERDGQRQDKMRWNSLGNWDDHHRLRNCVSERGLAIWKLPIPFESDSVSILPPTHHQKRRTRGARRRRRHGSNTTDSILREKSRVEWNERVVYKTAPAILISVMDNGPSGVCTHTHTLIFMSNKI